MNHKHSIIARIDRLLLGADDRELDGTEKRVLSDARIRIKFLESENKKLRKAIKNMMAHADTVDAAYPDDGCRAVIETGKEALKPSEDTEWDA